ncbi:hypothetical protein SAMN07250955_102244 [Arboricoccus pini]|uniref:Uncharacterized protein n=1 Tax=Arboricoccus pini TaxID=1963835 RepID=A0A212QPT2_9PROT|nr:hypothetical protein [Arboricoccus pini]SNB61445.1 hypothetical protein SAMN07250955_102244 [Arboricoccus pini]
MRHYTFRRRGDRRRMAVRLAAGATPAEVGAIERAEPHAISALLRDRGFANLVSHYRAMLALPAAERLARLAELAMEMLELAVAGGDLRAVTFVLGAVRAGQHPATELAEAVAGEMRAMAADPPPIRRPPSAKVLERRWRRQQDADVAEAARLAPYAPAMGAVPEGPDPFLEMEERQGQGEFGWWAGTCASPELACSVIRRAARREASVLGQAARRLRDLVMNEAERIGTAEGCDLALLDAVARRAQTDPEGGFAAARRLEALRRQAREGRPVDLNAAAWPPDLRAGLSTALGRAGRPP